MLHLMETLMIKFRIIISINILSIICFHCKEKQETVDINYHKLEFVNQAGYIKFPVDSIFNDTYLQFMPDCEGASWAHVIKNKNMPGIQKVDSLLKAHNNSICYLLISYPAGSNQITPLEQLDSIASINDSKLGPKRIKKSFIEKFGKNEFVLVKDYITDQKNYQ